jgi:tetratricopeptide (TPR) repeat protein
MSIAPVISQHELKEQAKRAYFLSVSHTATDESLTLLRKVLRDQETSLGLEHEDSLKTVLYLISIYIREKDFSKAIFLYERALRGFESVLGPLHEETMQILYEIVEICIEVNDIFSAKMYCQQHYAKQRTFFGPLHSSTKSAATKLESLLKISNETDNLIAFYRSLLTDQIIFLGEKHKETMETANKLAEIFCSREEYNEAHEMYEKLFLESKDTITEFRHLEQFAASYNFASIKVTLGKVNEAKIIILDIIDRVERVETKYRDTDGDTANSSAVQALLDVCKNSLKHCT